MIVLVIPDKRSAIGNPGFYRVWINSLLPLLKTKASTSCGQNEYKNKICIHLAHNWCEASEDQEEARKEQKGCSIRRLCP
jgi:hypothetical protein